MPIIRYRLVQTGANTELGGLKTGFRKAAYQPETDCRVKKEPIAPAAKHIAMLAGSFNKLRSKACPFLKSVLYRGLRALQGEARLASLVGRVDLVPFPLMQRMRAPDQQNGQRY